MDEIVTPTINDCISLVNTCCQMLHSSIAFQTSAQERQSALCEEISNQLHTVIDLCDKRTERIESAASKLADAAVSLSKACETNNTIIKNQGRSHAQSIEQHIKEKDQLMHSHQLLLKEFEAQRQDLQYVRNKVFDLCQQFANRPTTNISNSK